MNDPGIWGSWLTNSFEMQGFDSQVEVSFFASIEEDGLGRPPFAPLVDRMKLLDRQDWWFYALDDRRTKSTQANRLKHIAMGQNLCAEYAMEHDFDYMLLVGVDVEPPTDVISKLLEVDYPVVGAQCPVYALRGDRIEINGVECEEKLATGCVLIERSVFKSLRWSAQKDAGMSDDYHYQWQCKTFLGVAQMVRTDVVCQHYPSSIVEVENRYDTTVTPHE
jgi:hypothetical protein